VKIKRVSESRHETKRPKVPNRVANSVKTIVVIAEHFKAV